MVILFWGHIKFWNSVGEILVYLLQFTKLLAQEKQIFTYVCLLHN